MARAAKQRQTSRFVIALSSVKHGFASKTKSLSNIRCHQTTYSLRGLNPRPMAHTTIAPTTELRELTLIKHYPRPPNLATLPHNKFTQPKLFLMSALIRGQQFGLASPLEGLPHRNALQHIKKPMHSMKISSMDLLRQKATLCAHVVH